MLFENIQDASLERQGGDISHQNDHIRRTVFDFLVEKSNRRLAESANAQEQESNEEEKASYPIVRVLFAFAPSDFLNVVTMVFAASDFDAIVGIGKRQQLVDILLHISDTSANGQQIGHLYTFLARQLANKFNTIRVDDERIIQV